MVRRLLVKKRNPFNRTRCETNWSLLPGLFAVEKLLPDIREYSYHYTFQDGAPAHRARETVELPVSRNRVSPIHEYPP